MTYGRGYGDFVTNDFSLKPNYVLGVGYTEEAPLASNRDGLLYRVNLEGKIVWAKTFSTALCGATGTRVDELN